MILNYVHDDFLRDAGWGQQVDFYFPKKLEFLFGFTMEFYRSEFIKKEIIRVGWPDDSLNNK